MGLGILIGYVIILLLLILSPFIFFIFRKNGKTKIGLLISGIIVLFCASFLFTNTIDSFSHSKNDVKKDLNYANIELLEDFKIIENEVTGMPERFQKTILQITENDKNRLIYEIENGENFDKRKVRCVFLCYEYPEELVSNKSYYVNYKFNDNSIYVKWIHNIDLFFLKKDAKTFRIKLEEKDKWTDSTNVQIEDYLKKIRQLKSGAFGFPIPLSVLNNETKINNISKGILLTQIKKSLQEYSDIFYNH